MPTAQSLIDDPCLPRYRKWSTFSSGGSLPMTTLSRDASVARLLLDLTFCRSRSLRVIAAYSLRRTNAPCAFSGRVVCELTGLLSTPMHQVELRYVSLGCHTRSGRLVDGHHLAFLSGDDHCGIHDGLIASRSTYLALPLSSQPE